MKKKLLFIIPSLDSGGAEKNLVNLLNFIDGNRFDVNLLLLSRSGIFIDAVPNSVTLVDLPDNHRIFSQGLASSVKSFLKKGRIDLAYHRIAFAMCHRNTSNQNLAEQKAWKHMQKAIGILPEKYDVAIGYLEKTSIYLCVDSIRATKKIGFIRTDYSQLGLDANQDENYFKKLDYLCANGEESLRILQKTFPKLKEKVKLIINVVSPAMIRKMADESINLKPKFPTLLSIGRLKNVKGFDLAIEAAAILKDKNIDFRWLIIGEGAERQTLEAMIDTKGLADHVFLPGEISNPYPYLKLADIYVQTSRFEGRSGTINEAKIMAKPIVSTNFDSVFELLEDRKNALIVEKNPESIAHGIEELINNDSLRGQFITTLNETTPNTEAQLEKLYNLF